MKQTLHILKESESSDAIRIISEQESAGGREIRLLLIQRAVGLRPGLKSPVYVLENDLGTGGPASPYEKAGYPKMLEMILGADTVVTW